MSDGRALRLRQAAHRLALDSVLASIVRAFEEHDVRALLVKGPLFARWLYDDPAERPYRDIDLLVAPDGLDSGRRSLVDLGFKPWRTGEHQHERAGYHELWSRAGARPALVELHHTLFLLEAPPSSVWKRLSDGSETIEVAGARVEVPGPAACALIAALHAAQHGAGAARPIEDLERAVQRVDPETWRRAARLAQELGAGPAFAVGLGLTTGGRELAKQLDLSFDAPPRALRLLSSTPPPTAMGIEQLVAARGTSARMTLLARKLVPSRESMRYHYPGARRGRSGLAAAYASRFFTLALSLPRGWRAWHRAAHPPVAPPRRRGRFRNLRRRSWAERRLHVRAAVALSIVGPAVRLLPFRVVGRAIGLREGESAETPDGKAGERAVEIGWAVRSAASEARREPSCLVQALAAAALLRRAGIEATLTLGVAKDASAKGGVAAHAWLACGSLGLTGQAERHRYEPIKSFVLESRARPE